MSERQQLASLISVQKGKPPKSFEATHANTQPYLSPEYLRGLVHPTLAEPYPNSVTASSGDVILLWDGSNAGEAFRAKPGILASTMAVIRPDHSFDLGYFFHALKWAEPHLKSQTNGTGIPHVDRYVLGQIAVYRPSKLDQSKIAEILDTLDAAIRGTEAVVAKLRAMKQGLLHDLLTRGIDANGDLRPPHPEAPHLYQQTPLGWLPKEWGTARICEVGDVVTGRTPPAEDPSAWGDEAPFVTPGDIAHGQIVSQSERRISERGKKYVPVVRSGATTVVCIGSTIGKVGFIRRESAFNQQINAVVPSSSNDDAFIFSSICRSTDQLGRLAGLQAVPIVNKSEFQKIRIAICSKDEQTEISMRLSVTEGREVAEVDQLLKLIAAKSGLMDDLLTGRVSVSPLLSTEGAAHGA